MARVFDLGKIQLHENLGLCRVLVGKFDTLSTFKVSSTNKAVQLST